MSTRAWVNTIYWVVKIVQLTMSGLTVVFAVQGDWVEAILTGLLFFTLAFVSGFAGAVRRDLR